MPPREPCAGGVGASRLPSRCHFLPTRSSTWHCVLSLGPTATVSRSHRKPFPLTQALWVRARNPHATRPCLRGTPAWARPATQNLDLNRGHHALNRPASRPLGLGEPESRQPTLLYGCGRPTDQHGANPALICLQSMKRTQI